MCSVPQLCLTFCEPMDCSPPGSSLRGISQARIQEWVAISFSRGDLPDPGIEPVSPASPASPAWAGGFFTSSATWESVSSPSCLTFCDPMDCSQPGSSVHGILQARILERVAIPFSRGSFQPRDQTQVSCIAGRFFTI